LNWSPIFEHDLPIAGSKTGVGVGVGDGDGVGVGVGVGVGLASDLFHKVSPVSDLFSHLNKPDVVVTESPSFAHGTF
jgi:hypothetical protein